MKNLSKTKKQYYLVITVIMCFFAYPPFVCAIDIQQAKIQEKVIIQSTWGSGKGEIGEVPGRLDKTPGESINPIAADSKGNIYVGDSVNYRVQKYGFSGNYLAEIKLKNFDEWPYKNIPDIYIDSNDNIYIALLRKQQIVKFRSDCKLVASFDISKVGVLEKSNNGAVKLNAKKNFNIKKIVGDKSGNIYVLGSEENVLKLNPNGEIIQRWGPYASNANNFLFIDDLNILYIWMPPKKDGSMFKRYDTSGKFLGSGLGIYDQIIVPSYFDRNGNVYGFAAFTDNALAIYDKKNKKLFKLPLKEESLAFEKWTVDSTGNVYYTREGGKFEVIKMSLLKEGSSLK